MAHTFRFFKSFITETLWAIPVAIAVRDCVATVVRVDGASMAPTLNMDPSNPDWVLVDKLSVKWGHRYTRGDVVMFWAPEDPHQLLVKRIIGLEGDLVCEDGKDEPTRIPQGRAWLEGDNASQSGDSRNLYGPVHLGLLEGRATHIVWPPSHWREIASYIPDGKLLAVDMKDVPM